jgi:pyruvate kinase
MPFDRFLDELSALIAPLGNLAASLRAIEDGAAAELRAVDPAHLPSARNLLHYLALRRQDLRELQDRLAAVGLSSLGRAESCVESTLDRVLDLCHLATPVQGRSAPAITPSRSHRAAADSSTRPSYYWARRASRAAFGSRSRSFRGC